MPGHLHPVCVDPDCIALRKPDRGFDTDLDDIVFLIEHGFVILDELERTAKTSLPRAPRFDMDPGEVLAHLQELKNRLK